MFDPDTWSEIFSTLKRNRLRTFLTCLSVGWGIYMLVLLLGSGKGLENGVNEQFAGDAVNTIWVSGGQTAEPYHGYQRGRAIRLTNRDVDFLSSAFPEVEHLTSRVNLNQPVTVVHGQQYASFDVRGCMKGMRFGENIRVESGRFLNDPDQNEGRKVCCIGLPVKATFFPNQPAEGQYLWLGGFSFKVVGTFSDKGGPGDNNRIYIPSSATQRTFTGNQRVSQVVFSAGGDLQGSLDLANKVRNRLAVLHEFDAKDDRALYVNNNLENYKRVMQVLTSIRLFIWIIGLGTIFSGIVGVSNIMMIVVKERTREFGIRKALGATPRSLVFLVLQESVLITGLSGYIGLLLGIGTLEMAAKALPENDFFQNPGVDLRLALSALALLVACGLLAGFIPARRAASIPPVQALKEE